MSEWKKYDETTFTDFGSVGETMPVEGGSGMSVDSTIPADGQVGFDSSPFGETIAEDPAGESGELESWGSAGETVFDNMGVMNDAGETVRPATGWLVCIDGATRGIDYRIYQGYTYIGRDPSQNQIAIPDDHVSSVPSARILYETGSRKFFINETNGARNPVYLNGELFDGRVELHAYDIIKLGNTRLLFVPLCTEKFAWEE